VGVAISESVDVWVAVCAGGLGFWVQEVKRVIATSSQVGTRGRRNGWSVIPL
jgi:hypothetical protein